MNRRLFLLAPLAVAAGGMGGAFVLLERMQSGHYSPSSLPSMLIGKHPPHFTLLALPPGRAFSSADLAAPGRPILVNFFASWCLACIEEAPMLHRLARSSLSIWGIDYEDAPADARAYLARYGNPYARIDADLSGRVFIDWGCYGVPETYLVDPHGIVRWRWAGPLTPKVVAHGLDPLLGRTA